MRDHHALRTTRRAARIEEPCKVIGQGGRDSRRCVLCGETSVFAAAGDDHALECWQRLRERSNRFREVGRDEADARAGIVEDVLGLLRMELGVDRDGGETRPPRRPQELDILRAVFHEQRDAVAGYKAKPPARCRGEGAAAARERAVVRDDPLAERNRGAVGEDAGRAGEQMSEVHPLILPRISFQSGTCTVRPLNVISLPAAGDCGIGGTFAGVICGAAPGVPPRGTVSTTCEGGRGAPLFRWAYIRLSAWIRYTCSGTRRVS